MSPKKVLAKSVLRYGKLETIFLKTDSVLNGCL